MVTKVYLSQDSILIKYNGGIYAELALTHYGVDIVNKWIQRNQKQFTDKPPLEVAKRIKKALGKYLQ